MWNARKMPSIWLAKFCVCHSFSKSSLAFLYCNHPYNTFMAKKIELLWQGACNKNTYSDS